MPVINTRFTPDPEVSSPFPAGSGTEMAILARSLAGMPRGAVRGTLNPPGLKKASRLCWNISSFWIVPIADSGRGNDAVATCNLRKVSNFSKFVSRLILSSWSFVRRS